MALRQLRFLPAGRRLPSVASALLPVGCADLQPNRVALSRLVFCMYAHAEVGVNAPMTRLQLTGLAHGGASRWHHAASHHLLACVRMVNVRVLPRPCLFSRFCVDRVAFIIRTHLLNSFARTLHHLRTEAAATVLRHSSHAGLHARLQAFPCCSHGPGFLFMAASRASHDA